MVDVVFTVQSSVTASETISTEFNGQPITASIEALEVEFTSDHYGSLRLRFVGAEKDAVKDLFVEGSSHTWAIPTV